MEDYKNTEYKIPRFCAPAKYENNAKLPVNPYFVGMMLGTKYYHSKYLTLSLEDHSCIDKIAFYNKYEIIQTGNNIYRFKDKDGYVTTREFFKDTSSLINYNNHIPSLYKYSSIANRMSLLKGLIASNGEIDDEGNVFYNCKSYSLMEDVKELIWGLGLLITNINRTRIKIDMNKSIKLYLFPHKDSIIMPLPDVYLDRYLKIVNIRKVTRAHCKCIAVDAENKLYLTERFIVTHNTFMACYIAIKLGYRTLIIAPTTSIKLQWGDTLIKMFNVPKERVLVVNKPTDFLNTKADFVVVSQASLGLLYKKYDLARLMQSNNFGIKVIDEVQMWFHNILKIDSSSNIFVNLYLTGTFGRSSEQENELYQKMFGDLKIFREKDKPKTLFNRNPGNIYGMKPHMISTMVWMKSDVLKGLTEEQKTKLLQSWKYSEMSDKWSRIGLNIPLYTSYIIPPDGRMTKFLQVLLDVVKRAYKEVNYGKTLVLVPTISSVEIVAERLREILPDIKIFTIHSRNNPKENAKAKVEADLIVSTAASVGTGFDLPGLSRLINGQQIKSWILTDQVSGRLRRRPDGLDTYLWDIVDASIPQLRAWSKVRTEVLKRKSKKFDVINM